MHCPFRCVSLDWRSFVTSDDGSVAVESAIWFSFVLLLLAEFHTFLS